MERQSRQIGAPNFLPLIAWERATLAGARGDRAASARLLGEAHRGFVERRADDHAATTSRMMESRGPT
jgi:hypothetical protein